MTIINDKFDLEEFEDLDDDCVRIIGYFGVSNCGLAGYSFSFFFVAKSPYFFVVEPGSAALKEFEEAAEEFMGEVEFFAVVTSYWAKKVGLKRVGEVQVRREGKGGKG